MRGGVKRERAGDQRGDREREGRGRGRGRRRAGVPDWLCRERKREREKRCASLLVGVGVWGRRVPGGRKEQNGNWDSWESKKFFLVFLGRLVLDADRRPGKSCFG